MKLSYGTILCHAWNCLLRWMQVTTETSFMGIPKHFSEKVLTTFIKTEKKSILNPELFHWNLKKIFSISGKIVQGRAYPGA